MYRYVHKQKRHNMIYHPIQIRSFVSNVRFLIFHIRHIHYMNKVGRAFFFFMIDLIFSSHFFFKEKWFEHCSVLYLVTLLAFFWNSGSLKLTLPRKILLCPINWDPKNGPNGLNLPCIFFFMIDLIFSSHFFFKEKWLEHCTAVYCT